MRTGDVTDFGWLLIAFDPALLMPTDQFREELEELLTRIKNLAAPIRRGRDTAFPPNEASVSARFVVNKAFW
jgi:LDH2 family malate/lactate/ureidoglycolate dehydrogenase